MSPPTGLPLPDDFVLPVDKPEGPTSHDVVGRARRALGRRRVGHTGTLDPFASGLLLLCVGRATRLAEYLSALDKTYEAVARLGQTTDTLDREGVVLEESGGWAELGRADVAAALARLVGKQEQVPPAYSAKKVGGEAAHRRARRGERVELAPATITVHELELTSFEPPLVAFRVRCSSGTYVRALARDMGTALGTGGHLVALRRTGIGDFRVDAAIPTDRLDDAAALAAAAVDPLDALAHLPRVTTDAGEAALLAQGRALTGVDADVEGLVAVAHDGALLAVGEWSGGVLKPHKVFAS